MTVAIIPPSALTPPPPALAVRVCPLPQADVIAVMEKGRVVQQGSFKDLMADRSGAFGQLYDSAITHVA